MRGVLHRAIAAATTAALAAAATTALAALAAGRVPSALQARDVRGLCRRGMRRARSQSRL